MPPEHAVIVKDLVKEYRIYATAFSRVKEALSFGKRKFHMAHLSALGRRPQIGHGASSGERGKRQRPHKPAGAAGENGPNLRPGFHQEAREIDGFVSGNATGYAEYDDSSTHVKHV